MRVASEGSNPPPTNHQIVTGYSGLLATITQATAAPAEASGSDRAAVGRLMESSPFVTPAITAAGYSIRRSPAAGCILSAEDIRPRPGCGSPGAGGPGDVEGAGGRRFAQNQNGRGVV